MPQLEGTGAVVRPSVADVLSASNAPGRTLGSGAAGTSGSASLLARLLHGSQAGFVAHVVQS